MAATVRRLRFSSIANHFALRSDAKYRLFWGVHGGDLFPRSRLPHYPLKHALVPLTTRKLSKGELSGEYELVELEDVEQRTGVILCRHNVAELGSDKLLFGSADVLTTRLRPNLGKTIMNDPVDRLIGSTEWIPLRTNHKLLAPLLLKYFLLSPQYVDNAHRLLSGKEHPRIAEGDLLSLRVPLPERHVQENLVARIKRVEEAIDASRSKLRAPVEIINENLCKAFGYRLTDRAGRKRQRQFARGFDSFRASFTLRGSVRFHHPDYGWTDAFFARVPHERVKAFLSAPIRLGVSLSRDVMSDDGEAFYVHPSAIRREGRIDSEDCIRIRGTYYETNRRRAALRVGDLLMSRSGEGTIGKVALFDLDEPCLFSDFTMRIRFADNMNPKFAWYYFRTPLFQSQVEREKRGMGNMMNIFPSQVERLLVPTCPRSRQNALADQISDALRAREEGLRAIERRRREIAAMIESAIREGP
jgi:type I restriction enzyme S subunit